MSCDDEVLMMAGVCDGSEPIARVKTYARAGLQALQSVERLYVEMVVEMMAVWRRKMANIPADLHVDASHV